MASPLILVYEFPSDRFVFNHLPILNGTITEVNWGDGTIDTNTEHTYITAGTYTVQIVGSGITHLTHRLGE